MVAFTEGQDTSPLSSIYKWHLQYISLHCHSSKAKDEVQTKINGKDNGETNDETNKRITRTKSAKTKYGGSCIEANRFVSQM